MFQKKSIKNWTPWMILGCLYYTMYIVHRSGGTVLNSVGTSKSKTINVIKVRTFWEAHKIWKKSSSWFGRLLSKCTNHEKYFFQIVCTSQKVRTLKSSKTITIYTAILQKMVLREANFLQNLVGTNPNRPHMFRQAW